MSIMNKNILELIRVVSDNLDHVQNLETLADLLEDAGKINEAIVCKTTQNARYDYGLYGSLVYQCPENHINNLVKRSSEYSCSLKCVDEPRIKVVEHKLSYPKEDGRRDEIMKLHKIINN